MLHHIKELEKRTNKDRVEYVKEVLNNKGIEFKTQPFRFRVLKGENIIVNHFCQSETDKQLLLTAHTNKYFSSPGANDNASGVAVLLGIIEDLLEKKAGDGLGIKIIFFDHEDGLAYVDGSSYFVKYFDLSSIAFVLNLDGVGMGNTCTMSPKITFKSKSAYTTHLLEILKKRNIQFHSFNLPPLFSEDHVPFATKGVAAVSINTMSESDLQYLRNAEKKPFIAKLALMLFYRGAFRKQHPMVIMRHRHNELDTSKYIDSSSLDLCKKVVMEMIDFHKRLLSI